MYLIGTFGVDVKKTMACRRYQKLTHYLHVPDRANELAWNSADYDKLYKIHPVFNKVWDSFPESYKPGQNLTNDEGMIAYKGKLSYIYIYLPNQPREELRCWHTVMLIQYIYINLRCIVVNGKTLDMMWWWSYVRIYQEKSSYLLWQPVYIHQVIEELKTYYSGTIWVNKKYLPEGICKPCRMIHDA